MKILVSVSPSTAILRNLPRAGVYEVEVDTSILTQEQREALALAVEENSVNPNFVKLRTGPHDGCIGPFFDKGSSTPAQIPSPDLDGIRSVLDDYLTRKATYEAEQAAANAKKEAERLAKVEKARTIAALPIGEQVEFRKGSKEYVLVHPNIDGILDEAAAWCDKENQRLREEMLAEWDRAKKEEVRRGTEKAAFIRRYAAQAFPDVVDLLDSGDLSPREVIERMEGELDKAVMAFNVPLSPEGVEYSTSTVSRLNRKLTIEEGRAAKKFLPLLRAAFERFAEQHEVETGKESVSYEKKTFYLYRPEDYNADGEGEVEAGESATLAYERLIGGVNFTVHALLGFQPTVTD